VSNIIISGIDLREYVQKRGYHVLLTRSGNLQFTTMSKLAENHNLKNVDDVEDLLLKKGITGSGPNQDTGIYGIKIGNIYED
jgi:hypothetical protein